MAIHGKDLLKEEPPSTKTNQVELEQKPVNINMYRTFTKPTIPSASGTHPYTTEEPRGTKDLHRPTIHLATAKCKGFRA